MSERRPAWLQVFETLLSWLVFFEVYYYVTHDGEKTLHDAAREKASEAGEVLHGKVEIVRGLRNTHEEIRNLPETEETGNTSNSSNT